MSTFFAFRFKGAITDAQGEPVSVVALAAMSAATNAVANQNTKEN
jgi:hypothetical protein